MKARGACPTIATPMQTGDGLLARLITHQPMALDALCTLCTAAEEHGNGIIEVTQRGSLQIRGLTEGSAPSFARIVEALGIGTDGGPPLLTSPLLGLEAGEPFDCTGFVATLRNALSHRPNPESPGPKVSVLIDGGGKLHLDAVPADIRLLAINSSSFQVSLAGNASNASHLGQVSTDRAAAAIEDLLQLIAKRGPTARAKDLIPELKFDSAPPNNRPASEPIGTHLLKNGTVACGLALPFGHTTAGALRRLARAAADHGAAGFRPAPERSLLAIGLSQAAAHDLRESAANEGFVVDPEDARRHVVACAGTPACTSAKLPTRQLAPEVAKAARSLVGTSNMVHLSGCSKGCAHPGPAALTVVGPDRIVLKGRASDIAHATISSGGLLTDIERLCSEL
jgi:precorrin-3B synthase